MGFFSSDNIIAPATAVGMGAIGIIRLSGADCITIADSLFYPFINGSKRQKAATLKQTDSYKLRYGTISEATKSGDSKLLDDVMIAVFRAPHSYTGENCVEIYCHASQYIMNKLIILFIKKAEELLKAKKISGSLRMAAPGEFTQLAFINGKMDLAQAEAVADLIASETEAAHDVAMNQMRGGYSKELREMRERLLNLASLMELELDFSEEDVEFADRNKLSDLLEAIESKISGLIDSFAYGNAIKNGIPVAIVGAVNTGKSTLLNALAGEERAIVSDIQGTTRDTIEDVVNINGHTFRFIDTAGIRNATETIEILGIERTYQKLKEASVVILMLDCARKENFRESIASIASKIDTKRQKLIVVANKSDVLQKDSATESTEFKNVNSKAVYSETLHKEKNAGKIVENDYDRSKTNRISEASENTANIKAAVTTELSDICKAMKLRAVDALCVSLATDKENAVEALKKSLIKYGDNFSKNIGSSTLVTNARHYQALIAANRSLEKVSEGLRSHTPTDLVAQDIRDAISDLGSIIGEISSQDVLNNIFSKFCVGK